MFLSYPFCKHLSSVLEDFSVLTAIGFRVSFVLYILFCKVLHWKNKWRLLFTPKLSINRGAYERFNRTAFRIADRCPSNRKANPQQCRMRMHLRLRQNCSGRQPDAHHKKRPFLQLKYLPNRLLHGKIDSDSISRRLLCCYLLNIFPLTSVTADCWMM